MMVLPKLLPVVLLVSSVGGTACRQRESTRTPRPPTTRGIASSHPVVTPSPTRGASLRAEASPPAAGVASGAATGAPPTLSGDAASAASTSQSAPKLVRSLACSTNPAEVLARGRKLAGSGHWAEAITAYDPGVRKRPGDAILRAERGLALYKVGAQDLAEADWLVGLGLTPDKTTLGALHFNLGLLYQGQGNEDLARRHWVFAESLGNRAATRRLGAASRCVATWRSAAELEPAPLASNLRELVAARRFAGCPEFPAVTTEREAAARLCRSCAYAQWSEDEGCSTSFPLEVADGSLSFDLFTFYAEKFPDPRHPYIYFHAAETERPHWRVQGGFVLIETRSATTVELTDGLGSTLYATPEAAYTEDDSSEWGAKLQACRPEYAGEAEGPRGAAGPSPLSGNWRYPITIARAQLTTLYKVETRAPVLSIESAGGDVSVAVNGQRIHIAGANCDEIVDL